MSLKELNELEFKRLTLVNDYLNIQKQLEARLSLAGVCISKAKTTHGVTLFSVNSVDAHDLEPSVHVKIENEQFTIIPKSNDGDEKKSVKNRKVEEAKQDDENDSEKTSKPTPIKGQFRPFGILEPSSAKEARSEMKKCIELICELATIQNSIKSVDAKLRNAYETCKCDEELAKSLKSLIIA
ncbi:unnamed protein product [Caenorhabditis bovis]|uniref:Vacuolar ATPase assembly protein VMA22 n=1 Tax=Caenorhabditis bovis TaxID=2654633 RepID=A0A8S1F9T2_9PELO|nr:unnamed protein product [Caenorhabditis bovis]